MKGHLFSIFFCQFIYGAICEQDSFRYHTITQDEKNELVNAHNQCRRDAAAGKLQKTDGTFQPAGMIPDVAWDDEIAQQSKNYINQILNFNHTCPTKHTPNTKYAENLHWGNNLTKMVNSRIIPSWCIESSWYDYIEYNGTMDTLVGNETKWIAHYLNVVAARITKIGCGICDYVEDKKPRMVLYCNYDHGPKVGDFPYPKIGSSNSTTEKPKQQSESIKQTPPQSTTKLPQKSVIMSLMDSLCNVCKNEPPKVMKQLNIEDFPDYCKKTNLGQNASSPIPTGPDTDKKVYEALCAVVKTFDSQLSANKVYQAWKNYCD